MEEDRNTPAHVESDSHKISQDTQLVVEDHSTDLPDPLPPSNPTNSITLSSSSPFIESKAKIDDSKTIHPFAQAHILSMAIESESASSETINVTKVQEPHPAHSPSSLAASLPVTPLCADETSVIQEAVLAGSATCTDGIKNSIASPPLNNGDVQQNLAGAPPSAVSDDVPTAHPTSSAAERDSAAATISASSTEGTSEDVADDNPFESTEDPQEPASDNYAHSPEKRPRDSSGSAESKPSPDSKPSPHSKPGAATSGEDAIGGTSADGGRDEVASDCATTEKAECSDTVNPTRDISDHSLQGELEKTDRPAPLEADSSSADTVLVAGERETLSQIIRDSPSKSREDFDAASSEKLEVPPMPRPEALQAKEQMASTISEKEICKDLLSDSVVDDCQPPLKKARLETLPSEQASASSAETVSSSVKESEFNLATFPREFETVRDAIEAIPPPVTIHFVDPVEHGQESSDEEDGGNSDTKKRCKRRRMESEIKAAGAAKPVETRSAPGTPSRADDNDTEPEQISRQSKRRRTIASASASGTASRDLMTTGTYELLPELTLQHLTTGWTRPLLYFVEGFDYDWGDNKAKKGSGDASKSKWLTYPDLRISNGAIYIDQHCSGVASLNLKDHLTGPTWIMRDLCSLFQAGSTPSLHQPNYVSLSRATARTQLKVTEPFTELAITKVFRAGSERESIQPLPLDYVCHFVVQSVRAVVTTSGMFPSHLFAPEMHLWQFAPSLALLLMAAGLSRSPAALLEYFDSGDILLTKLNCLKDVLAARTGTRTTTASRRRSEKTHGRGKVPSRSGLKTFTLEADEKDLVSTICDLIENRLKEFKNVKFETAGKESERKEYLTGDQIIHGIELPLIPRTSAVLRDRALSFYAVKPCLIQVAPEAVDDTSRYEELCKLFAKEDSRWVTTAEAEAYIDLTLSKDQERWLMSASRCKSLSPAPTAPKELNMLQELIEHASDSPSNCELKISLPVIRYGDCCSNHSATVSLIATQDISSKDHLRLATTVTRVSWPQLADDGLQAIETTSNDH